MDGADDRDCLGNLPQARDNRSRPSSPDRDRNHDLGALAWSPQTAMTVRRFPAPWTAELQPNYYVVRDANGQQIAYVHYSNDPDRRSAAKLMTKDEARRIAVNSLERGAINACQEVGTPLRPWHPSRRLI